MGTFILRRAIQAVVVVLAVATALFFLMRLSGDPVLLMLGPDATPQSIEQVRHDLGFDQPLPVQYVKFLGEASRLKFGQSLMTKRDALSTVKDALPNTLTLAFGALVLGLSVAFPVGIYSALKRNSLGAFFAMIGAIAGVSVPGFWLGILLILLFSVQLHWLPSFGTGGFTHWILPMVTLSFGIMARQSRLVRAGMLDVLQQDYIRTAYTKGLRQRVVLVRHAIKNAILPSLAVLSIDMSFLVGGALIIEQVFAIPGMGRQVFQAISGRDYPVVQSTIFIVAIMVVIINFVIDVAYGYADPRISLESVE